MVIVLQEPTLHKPPLGHAKTKVHTFDTLSDAVNFMRQELLSVWPEGMPTPLPIMVDIPIVDEIYVYTLCTAIHHNAT